MQEARNFEALLVDDGFGTRIKTGSNSHVRASGSRKGGKDAGKRNTISWFCHFRQVF
jgi:hypothetical protein